MNARILVLLVLFLLTSCQDDDATKRESMTVIDSNPLAEVKAQVDREPKNADAWFHLANLYERSTMYAEEIEALQQVVSIDPRRGYAYVKLGNAFNRREQYREAIGQFLKARTYLPNDPVLYNNLAYSYDRAGRPREQLATLEKAVSLRPNYATARFNLGLVRLRRGERQQAIVQYNALLKFDAGTAELLKKEIDAGAGRPGTDRKGPAAP